MPRLTDEREQEIRARCEAATQPPWADNVNELWHGDRLIGEINNSLDAEFIAHAREDIPALLDEIAALRDKGNCAKCRFNGSSRPCSTCIWSGLNGSDYFEPLPAPPNTKEE